MTAPITVEIGTTTIDIGPLDELESFLADPIGYGQYDHADPISLDQFHHGVAHRPFASSLT